MANNSIQITDTPPLPGTQLVAELNDAFEAVATDFSGPIDPAANAFAYSLWADTSTGNLKRRDGTNSIWNVVGRIFPTVFEDASGNLLVGTTTASARLTVIQPSGADREVILAGVTGVSNGLQVRYISGAMSYMLGGLGTGTVSSSGGTLSASSDQNMKIADGYVDTALEKVAALTPRYFYWKDKNGEPNLEQGRQLGFFAQEVNAVIPEAAPAPNGGEDGWGVYDRGIVATLVKAIQEQQALITQLQADVAALKA